MRISFGCAIAALWLAGGIAPAWAQQPSAVRSVDPRWTAWLGCWQQLEESVRDEGVEPGRRDNVPIKGVVVCVTPADILAAVTLSTIVEKQAALRETIVADGSNRLIDEPGCTGSQRARWSANGRRLFAHAELSCADGTTRAVSGLTTMAPGPVWLDIQVVNAAGRESIRVRRYRRAPDQAYARSALNRDELATAATAAARHAASFSLEEVQDAMAAVTPSAVEAALIETGAGFPLNAKRLRELDAAGVPDRILDLMIALSFPNRFVVERHTERGTWNQEPRSTWGGAGGLGDWGWMDASYDLFPYRYAPFGYGMWGLHDIYYGAPVYAVEVVSSIQPSGQGRVVDGLGYTRVRTREPQPTAGGGTADGGGWSTSGGSGGVSSQGYSGGGGSGSGRTAVARPPG
ncbi:MAG: hypothetical protein ACRD26_06660 [Vicinamibacterales bacterium]